MARKKAKLGQMLVEAGLIDEFQLNSALSHQRNCGGGRLGNSLVKLKYVTEENLLSFLAEQLDLPRIDLSRRRIPASLLAFLPAEAAWRYKAIPVDRKEMNGALCLLVAMADPTDGAAVEALQRVTGSRVRPALAFESAIVEALVNHYGPPLMIEEEPHRTAAGEEPAAPRTPSAGVSVSSRERPATLEEKYHRLLKILHNKGILSLRELERLK